MIPKYLKLINFRGHKETELDFSKIPNATIVIGMKDGSLDESNAVGKTTLFNAMFFALFDAVEGKKNKVIREGQNKCEVEFIFEISSGVYKIYRSRTKSSKNVSIFKLNNDNWDDLSGRTNTHTEEIICKITGVSKKLFENSSYFKQKDKFDLASATPEKRKLIIIEMLHLNEWNAYEKYAKNKKTEIENDLTSIKQTLSMTGNPKEIIKKCNEDLKKVKIKLEEVDCNIKNQEDILKDKTKNLNILESKTQGNIKELEKKSINTLNTLQNTKKEINNIQKDIEDKNKQKESIINKYKDEQNKYNNFKIEYEHLTSNYPEEIPDDIYNNLNNDIIHYNNLISSAESSFKILAKDIPNDDFCPTCFTELNEENRKKAIQTKQEKLSNISKNIKEFKEKRKEFVDKKNEYDFKISEFRKYNILINNCKQNILSLESSMSRANDHLAFLNKVLSERENNLKENILFKETLIKTSNDVEKELNEKNDKNLDKKIYSIKEEIKKINFILKNLKYELNNLSYKKGSLEKEIETAKNNLQKIEDLKKIENEKEKTLLLYKASVNVFSSYGIPAMIISTVLDSLQAEANSVLSILRPNLQLQFFLEKERSDGKQEDTLGMKFFVNSVEWDYEDLSGGQQACISLALKFAISVINRKRCGADIRLLLLDEVDRDLDAKGIKLFNEVIKKWSNDMFILVITHNEKLKDMFESFILVSKDNEITTAKVVE
jgi:exonuclease SbcC